MKLDLVSHVLILASFPGSPHTQTKNQKERGEPGKIYHVRNVIGRENLITCGWTNELARALLKEYTRSVMKALWLTEQDWTALCYITWQYSELTQTCTFENHGNLRAYLTNWLLTGTVHSGEWLSKHYKTPRRPFSKLCSNLLCAYWSNKLPERGPTIARLHVLSIMPLRAWHINDPLTWWNVPGPLPLFHTASEGKLGRAGTRVF